MTTAAVDEDCPEQQCSPLAELVPYRRMRSPSECTERVLEPCLAAATNSDQQLTTATSVPAIIVVLVRSARVPCTEGRRRVIRSVAESAYVWRVVSAEAGALTDVFPTAYQVSAAVVGVPFRAVCGATSAVHHLTHLRRGWRNVFRCTRDVYDVIVLISERINEFWIQIVEDLRDGYRAKIWWWGGSIQVPNRYIYLVHFLKKG